MQKSGFSSIGYLQVKKMLFGLKGAKHFESLKRPCSYIFVHIDPSNIHTAYSLQGCGQTEANLWKHKAREFLLILCNTEMCVCLHISVICRGAILAGS